MVAGGRGSPSPCSQGGWPDCQQNAGHGCPLWLCEWPLHALGLSQATLRPQATLSLGAFGLCLCILGVPVPPPGATGAACCPRPPSTATICPHSTHRCPCCSGTGCGHWQSPPAMWAGTPRPCRGARGRGRSELSLWQGRWWCWDPAWPALKASVCRGGAWGGPQVWPAWLALCPHPRPPTPPFTHHFGLFAAQTDTAGEAEAAHAEGAEPAV